jgi:putative membrane protein
MTRVVSFATIVTAVVFAATAFAQRTEGQRSGIPIPPVEAEAKHPEHSQRYDKAKEKEAKHDFGPMTSENVLNKLYQDNLKEIAMGHLAMEKGSSEEVRYFGERLIQDHGKANEEVKQLAANLNITLQDPKADKKLEKKQKDHMAKLEALSGEEFDTAFLAAMDKDHQKGLALLRKAQAEVKDESVAQLAAKLTPVILHHKRITDTLQGETERAEAFETEDRPQFESEAG